MGGNRQNVSKSDVGHESYNLIATATPSRSGMIVVYQSADE
jgi:hypothetical protein